MQPRGATIFSLILGALLSSTACGCASAQATAQPSIADVFERVEGSVVLIRVAGKQVLPGAVQGTAGVESIGSGTLVSREGRILTAAHVVQTADEVEVFFPTGERISADIVTSSPVADVALLQLTSRPPASATVALIGDSDRVRTGEEIFVIGAPRGVVHTLTVGHVSARRKGPSPFMELEEIEVIQTDAAINEGNSGGPMFNLRGELIGVVSFILSQSGGSEGIGFAISTNTARRLLLEAPAFWSGAGLLLLQGDLARVFNTPGGAPGLLVQHVAKDSPAERLGLRGGDIEAVILGQRLVVGGDIVLEVMGIPIGAPGGAEQLREARRRLTPGNAIEVKVLREGAVLGLRGALPADSPPGPAGQAR